MRPPEVFALSRYAENFEKELHFVQIFSKILFAFDTLLANQSAKRKKTEDRKMSFCKLQKSLFRLPSSVTVFLFLAQSTKHSRGGVVVYPL